MSQKKKREKNETDFFSQTLIDFQRPRCVSTKPAMTALSEA